MFSAIKSIGSKAISSLPGVGNFGRYRIQTESSQEQLEWKLKQISNLILKSPPQQQFKLYSTLIADESTDFNRQLGIIYQSQGCSTEKLVEIIRFYTFLLTNLKNELVICKLVSQPILIELTKIVLSLPHQIGPDSQDQYQIFESSKQTRKILRNGQNCHLSSTTNLESEDKNKADVPQPFGEQNIGERSPQGNQQYEEKVQIKEQQLTEISGHSQKYLQNIDWEEVNIYKVALIRSYINCINSETVNYMITTKREKYFLPGSTQPNFRYRKELPIFNNCISGYRHYLTGGVEGTCVSNCILMIINKVNLNDEVCDIIFQQITTDQEGQSQLAKGKLLKKRIDDGQKTIKIDAFIGQVVGYISKGLDKILGIMKVHSESLWQRKLSSNQEFQRGRQTDQEKLEQEFPRADHSVSQLLGISEQLQDKVEETTELIESNVLFCMDLINEVHNYNYTHQLKQAIGKVVEEELTRKVIQFAQSVPQDLLNSQRAEDARRSKFSLLYLRLLKLVFSLSVLCSKEQKLVHFLNTNILLMLENLLQINRQVFGSYCRYSNQSGQQNICESNENLYSSRGVKTSLSYLCTLTLVLLKQTLSPYSMLASRKRLEVKREFRELKEEILSRLFTLLEQIAKFQTLREKICFKGIRNLLLTVFYLTIKEEKCEVFERDFSPTLKKKENVGLLLEFKYNILLLHKVFTLGFHKVFTDNRNWEYIINNYESLMREVPNSILSPEQKDKYCHFHTRNNCQAEDQLRNIILICEAVRNYRYMIIHESTLESRLIRLENIYHRHFMSPGWDYVPGQVIAFKTAEEYKVVCNGFLHNNSSKLPVEMLQDFECLILTHRLAQHKFKIIANIRYKKIVSSVPEGKHVIRLKLLGIQQLLIEFSSSKILNTFQDYVVENRNRSREKELKFINFYLGLYLQDSEKLIQQIYSQDLEGLDIFEDQKIRNERQEPKRLMFPNKIGQQKESRMASPVIQVQKIQSDSQEESEGKITSTKKEKQKAHNKQTKRLALAGEDKNHEEPGEEKNQIIQQNKELRSHQVGLTLDETVSAHVEYVSDGQAQIKEQEQQSTKKQLEKAKNSSESDEAI